MYKIPIQNIYYILCYAWDMGDLRDKVNVDAEKCKNISNLLIHLLLNATDELLRRGLTHGYSSRYSETDSIKGKIIISDTLKSMRFRIGKAWCNYDDYSSNILLNQIIYSSLREAIRIDGLSTTNKDRLIKTLRQMPKIKSIRINDNTFNQIKIHRNNVYYSFAINICKLLHKCLLPKDTSNGLIEFKNLLEDENAMNRIFEKFLLNFYKQEFKDEFPKISSTKIQFKLTPFGMFFSNVTDDALSLLPIMKTDITLENPDTKKKIIIDAKYYKETLVSKYGNSPKIRRDHISQILTYVINQENNKADYTKEAKGIIVYPTVDINLDVSYRYKETKHLIQISTINLNQDWTLIEKRLKEIIVAYDLKSTQKTATS